jgi:hypothetical protein
MAIYITVFWDGKPCSSVEICKHFGETCCIHLQGLQVPHPSGQEEILQCEMHDNNSE